MAAVAPCTSTCLLPAQFFIFCRFRYQFRVENVRPEDWRGANCQAEGGRVESGAVGEGALQDRKEGRVGCDADQFHGG